MVELVDVHGVVEMTSGFVDRESHAVVASVVDVDVDVKPSLEIRHVV